MANCVKCGRELPAFSFGSPNSLCSDCKALAASQPETLPPGDTPQRVASWQRMPVTTALVAINVAVFVAMVVTGVSPMEPTIAQLLKWGANWGPLTLGGQPWRLLTSNYVHIGLFHIGLNMWCLWNLGFLAERIFDRWTYILTYTFCGLAGSVVSLWWHPTVVGAGASGAIFGLAGALIAALYLGKLPISKEAIRSTLKSLVAFAGYNLLFGLRPGVDNSAHLGGLVSGLAIGAVLARHLLVDPDTRHRWRTYAFVVAALVLVMGTGFAAKRFHSSSESGVVSQAKDLEALQDALEALKRKDFQNAVAPLQGVIERNPRSVDAYYLLGLAYLGTNQPDEAIVQFKKALEINPRSSEVESGLAQAYGAKGMNAEADEANKKAEEFKQSDQ